VAAAASHNGAGHCGAVGRRRDLSPPPPPRHKAAAAARGSGDAAVGGRSCRVVGAFV